MNRFPKDAVTSRKGRGIAALALLVALLPAGVVAHNAGFLSPVEEPGLPAVAHRVASGEGFKIVAFGSSSTRGIGASTPAGAYPARLEAVLNKALPKLAGGVTVVNRGVNGEDVDDMVRRLDRDVLDARPDLVIWQTGSNDPLRKVPLDHFREETAKAVARMREAGIDVLLMEPQWCPKLDATEGAYLFRDAVREIGAEMDVPVIRRSDMMKEWVQEARITPKELFAPDGLHMADGGYAILARETATEILREADAVDGMAEAAPAPKEP